MTAFTKQFRPGDGEALREEMRRLTIEQGSFTVAEIAAKARQLGYTDYAGTVSSRMVDMLVAAGKVRRRCTFDRTAKWVWIDNGDKHV